jgi:hypothetical protein
MKIQQKHLFHGAALTQIVEHLSFKALNKADDGKYGHYQINHDRKLLVKHTQNGTTSWQFTFQQDDLKTLQNDIDSSQKTYICLVCGQITVCAIDTLEIQDLLTLPSTQAQWIRVKMPPGGSLWAEGSKGSLLRAIPHNSFPNKVFS